MNEKKETGDISNPYFQKGKTLGLQALDPLSEENLTDEIMSNRDQFLTGYARGLKQYIENKKIILPLMNISVRRHFEEDFTQPHTLLGYSSGLRRENPNTPDSIFGDNDEEIGEIANGFRAVSIAIGNISKHEGYCIGFIVGAVRDYGIVLNGSNVPNADEYAVFLAGLEGKPLDSVPNPNLTKNWATQFDSDFAEMSRNSVYEGGSKLRSQKNS